MFGLRIRDVLMIPFFASMASGSMLAEAARPYPPSGVIEKVDFAPVSSIVRKAVGSDNYTEKSDCGDTHGYRLPGKWVSHDGTTMYLLFSGRGEYDAFCVRKMTLTLHPR